MILRGPDELLSPLREALRDAPADEADIHLHRRRAAITRYSHSSIHQNALSDETHVRVRAIVGRAVGVVESNSLDVTDLRRSLAGAAELARASRPDDGWPGLADPETVTKPHAFDEATATAGAADQAAAIAHICRGLRSGMRAAGTSQHELTEDAVANTRGVALYARGSLAYLRALAARAVEKCALDRDRSELAPGDYEAVFEELAVAEILRIVSLTGLGGQSVKEGRSFMTGRIGEKVTGEAFTLVEDALDPRTLAIPFDVEGTPKRRVTLVERGVAKGPVYDRTSAKAMGTRSTGHAADPSRYATGGHAANLTMAGGAASRDELVRAVGRGILITRFHYTNTPDPRAATMTGTTRDGTFLIEDGKITRALANVRYTMSALELFAGIELLGAQRLARDWWSSNGMGSVVCVVPPMKVRRATITGSSPR